MRSVRSAVLATVCTAAFATAAVGGTAQAATLNYVSAVNPERLVQSTGNLYWTSNTYNEFGESSSRVYRASKLARPGEHRLLYLARHAGNVQFGALAYAKVGESWYGYVVSNNMTNRTSRILRVPLAGGAAEPLFASPRYIGARDLVSDGSRLFWADEGGVRAATVTGGVVATRVSGTASISKLEVAHGRLYFAFGNSVRRMPLAGGAITTEVTTNSRVTALDVRTVFPAILYWGQADHALKSRAIGGSIVTTHQGAVTGRTVTSVASDGSRVLWTSCSLSGNACTTKKKDSGSTVTVATNRVGLRDVQGDATAMFWSSHAVERYTH